MPFQQSWQCLLQMKELDLVNINRNQLFITASMNLRNYFAVSGSYLLGLIFWRSTPKHCSENGVDVMPFSILLEEGDRAARYRALLVNEVRRKHKHDYIVNVMVHTWSTKDQSMDRFSINSAYFEEGQL